MWVGWRGGEERDRIVLLLFVCLFVHAFVRSFVRPFVRPFVCLFFFWTEECKGTISAGFGLY